MYAVRNDSELNRLYLLNDLGGKNLVVVTLPAYFEAVVDFYLKNSMKTSINGIVLNTAAADKPQSPEYSDDASRPNQNFGLYTNRSSNPASWNPAGTSNMFHSFKIPIYVITDQEEAERPFKDQNSQKLSKVIEFVKIYQICQNLSNLFKSH